MDEGKIKRDYSKRIYIDFGPGKKPSYDSKIANAAFRVPVEKKDEFQKKVKKILDEYKQEYRDSFAKGQKKKI